MTAYGNIDSAVAGLKDSLGGFVESWRAAEEIAAGLPVFGYEGDAVNAYGYKKDVGILLFDADFVTSNSIVATVNGVATAAVPFNTDHDTTAADLVTAIAALAGVEAVLDPADTNNRTILIRIKGATAVVSAVVTGGASQAGATATYGSGQVFIGISMYDQKEAGAYAADEAMNVMARDGRIWATTTTGTDANKAAKLDSAGTFANAGTELGCLFRSTEAAAGLAIVEVNGQKALTYASSFA